MANSNNLIGSLVVTFSISAMAEVARPVRFINVLLGLWLVVAPWLLDGVSSPLAVWNSIVVGLVLIVLTLPRGPVKNAYNGWDRYLA